CPAYCEELAVEKRALVRACAGVGMQRWFLQALIGGSAGAALAGVASTSVPSQTPRAALVQAYQNNPPLKSHRATVRATDEGVPQALAGYRPKVTASASLGEQYWSVFSKSTVPGTSPYQSIIGTVTPNSYGITASQTLFNGFQTANKTR